MLSYVSYNCTVENETVVKNKKCKSIWYHYIKMTKICAVCFFIFLIVDQQTYCNCIELSIIMNLFNSDDNDDDGKYRYI